MGLFVLGLVLFLGAHSLRVFAEGWRTRLIARLGDKLFKGFHSLALAWCAGTALCCGRHPWPCATSLPC